MGDVYNSHRTLIWLCVVIFVNQLGFGSVAPVVPLYAKSFGVSISAIGLSVAIYGVARFVGNVPTAQLADRFGRRWTLVIGEVITTVGNVMCGLSTDYPQFLVGRFVAGLGAAMIVTSGQIVLADLTNIANRGRTMSIYQGAFLSGVGLGPLPGGVLAESFGLSFPFYAFAAVGVIAGVVAFDKVPETRGLARQKLAAAPQAGRGPNQLGRLLSRPGFLLVSLVAFAQFYARTGVMFSVLPIFAASKLDLSADQIGSGLTAMALTNVAMVYFAGMLVDRVGRKAVIVPSGLISGVAVGLFTIAPDYGWFLAYSTLWGLAAGISGPAPAAYAADMAPPGMNAMTMGAFRFIGDFGYVVGPLAAGWIADSFGSDASFLSTAALWILSSALFALFAPETAPKRKDRQKLPSPA